MADRSIVPAPGSFDPAPPGLVAEGVGERLDRPLAADVVAVEAQREMEVVQAQLPMAAQDPHRRIPQGPAAQRYLLAGERRHRRVVGPRRSTAGPASQPRPQLVVDGEGSVECLAPPAQHRVDLAIELIEPLHCSLALVVEVPAAPREKSAPDAHRTVRVEPRTVGDGRQTAVGAGMHGMSSVIGEVEGTCVPKRPRVLEPSWLRGARTFRHPLASVVLEQ